MDEIESCQQLKPNRRPGAIVPDAADPDAADLDRAGSGDSEIVDLAWPIPMAVSWPLAAVVVAGLAMAFGVDIVLASVLPFGALLGVLTVIDLRELRVPRVLKPAYVIAVPLLLISATTEWRGVSLVQPWWAPRSSASATSSCCSSIRPGWGGAT